MDKPLKLHLGCGNYYLEGYINIDFPPSEHTIMKPKADLFADLRSLYYKDGSVDEIRNHHVFEHFSRAEALKLLLTWRRWLKVGGRLHIETPDFDRCLIYYFFCGFKTKSEIGRHIFGSQEAKWANHLDYWNKRKFLFVFKKLGFKIIKTERRSNSFSRYFNTRLFNWIGIFIPLFIYKKFGGNKLPNITVIAEKTDEVIDEEKSARDILSLYLVGRENEKMLSVWIKEVFNYENSNHR